MQNRKPGIQDNLYNCKIAGMAGLAAVFHPAGQCEYVSVYL